MVMTEGASPTPVKVDRPVIVDRLDENTIVYRHFQDDSQRTTIYDPQGGAKVVTHRTNPSTGAAEKTVEHPSGYTEKVIERPDGSSTLTITSPTGEVERTEQGRDADGNPTRTTHYPDGGVETEIRIPDENGYRQVLTRADGSKLVTTVQEATLDNRDVVSSIVYEESTGHIRSQVTVAHPDGSSDITVREGPNIVETKNVTRLPDGATRERVSRSDGSVETTITREYVNADGAKVQEVLEENQIRITTTRRDGSKSDVTKYDDGTFESTDTTLRPDGSIVHTRTARDQSWETVEQHPAKPGEVIRTVTTRSDGTKIDQSLDAERMHTIVHRPDGTRLEVRRDFDGVGSTGEYDANGTLTSVTYHDGEPLEPFPHLGDQEDEPPIGGQRGDAADHADEPLGQEIAMETDPVLADAVLADVFTDRVEGADGDELQYAKSEVLDESEPVLGIEGRGIALEREVYRPVQEQLGPAEPGPVVSVSELPSESPTSPEPEPIGPRAVDEPEWAVEPEPPADEPAWTVASEPTAQEREWSVPSQSVDDSNPGDDAVDY